MQDRVDHRQIADDDGDEGLADGPVAGLLRAGGRVREDDDAADDAGDHDEDAGAEEDRQADFLLQPDLRFPEHLRGRG